MPELQRPEWIQGLATAKSREDWLRVIVDSDDAAVLGLLRRHELPTPGGRTARLEVVQQALEGGLIGDEGLDAWRNVVLDAEMAVESLEEFRRADPLAQQFRAEHGLEPGNKDAIKDSVQRAIWSGELELFDWLDFLDPLRVETDRHLFLYRLPPTAVQVFADLTERHEKVWKSEAPRLVAVDRDNGGNRLVLRWVSWRRWQLAAEGAVTEEQRAVSFLRVDLGERTAALHLPRLRRGGMSGLVAEREAHVKAIAATLGVRLERLPLEPALRALLSDHHLNVDAWRVRLPSGGELRGQREDGLFARVQLAFQRFYALELKGEWVGGAAGEVPVQMDARTDAVEIFGQYPPALVADLLATVRQRVERAAAAGGAAPPPAGAAPATPGGATTADPELDALRTLVEKLVAYLRQRGFREVSVDGVGGRETTLDLLSSGNDLRRALDGVGLRYLGASFYVVCPQTGKPVERDGRVVEFERLGDVPAQIECNNESGRVHHHRTEGNVWLRVGQVARQGPGFLASVGLAVGFTTFLTLVTWVYVLLLDAYSEHQIFVTVGYLLSVFAPFAAIYLVYGKEAFVAVAEHLLKFKKISN